MKWEFKVIKSSGTLASGGEFTLAIEQALNQYGKDGWEIHYISIQDGKEISGKYALIILKREVKS